jgi:ubiquinone/menaquinone biosynthesis C-methylase UbiE
VPWNRGLPIQTGEVIAPDPLNRKELSIVTYRDLCVALHKKMKSIIAPDLKYSQSIYEETLLRVQNRDGCWLDLGCGHNLLPPWKQQKEIELVGQSRFIVGLDYDYKSLVKHTSIKNKIRGDMSDLPFANDSFDFITSNMVFEHLREPCMQLNEIFRILKPNGILLFHTPNTFGYNTMLARIIPDTLKNKIIYILQNRVDDDVFPAYYRINSVARIRRLAHAAGFNILKIRLIMSSAQVVIFPPLAQLELILIRLLMTSWLKPLRTNIIAILEKP